MNRESIKINKSGTIKKQMQMLNRNDAIQKNMLIYA